MSQNFVLPVHNRVTDFFENADPIYFNAVSSSSDFFNAGCFNRLDPHDVALRDSAGQRATRATTSHGAVLLRRRDVHQTLSIGHDVALRRRRSARHEGHEVALRRHRAASHEGHNVALPRR